MKKGYWCKQRELVTILDEDKTHYLIQFSNGGKYCTDKNTVADVFEEKEQVQTTLF